MRDISCRRSIYAALFARKFIFDLFLLMRISERATSREAAADEAPAP